MKRYLIPIIIISVLVSGLLLGCDSEPKSTQTPTNSELQTQVETLQEELNRLREQDKAETLQQAESYRAIVEFIVGGSSESSSTEKPTAGISEPTGIQPLTVEAIVGSLTTSSKVWGLIKATEDPYLISTCQPNEWGQMPVSYSFIKNYAEGKYRELMSKYYNQEYIDDQLSMIEKSTEKTEEKAVVNTLPFTYTGKGNGRTPTIMLHRSQETTCEVNFTTSWDGDISMIVYQIRGGKPYELLCRSTGTWNDFPDRVESGVTYEFIDVWGNKEHYLEIGDAPPDGEWTVTISEAGRLIEIPFSYNLGHLTVFFEYDGESIGRGGRHHSKPEADESAVSTASGNWRTTASFVNVGSLPIIWNFWRTDEGTGPMTLTLLYEYEVVVKKIVVEHDEVHVIWLAPSDPPTPEPYSKPVINEMWYAADELRTVQRGVWSLMDYSKLMLLPNPATVPTNDMNVFPDATSVAGSADKQYDRNGTAYGSGDKNGYTLYQFDRIADNSQSELYNSPYSKKQYTTGTYTVDACGKVTQVTTGYE